MTSAPHPSEVHLPNSHLLVNYLAMCHHRLLEVLDSNQFKFRKWSMPHRAMFFDLHKHDPMRQFFKSQAKLWREGKPGWGYLLLIDKEFDDRDTLRGTGVMIHSLEPAQAIHPDALTYLAFMIGQALGSSEPEKEIMPLIKKLYQDNERLFGDPVPPQFSNGIKLGLTHVCLDKKKLLHQPLQRHPFPALIQTQAPHFATLMPHWTWPLELYDYWESLSKD